MIRIDRPLTIRREGAFLTIPEIRQGLMALAGFNNSAHLSARSAHEAVKLILRIKPNAPLGHTIRLALGLTVVELGPPNTQDQRRIEFIDHGGSSELWAGYNPKPRYFAQPDHSVKVVWPSRM